MAAEIEKVPREVLLNPVVKNLCAMASRAWKNRWIVTLTGATGVGKTTAIGYADSTLPFPHQVIACKQITTRYTILRAIGLDPGQTWRTHGRNWTNSAALYEQAVERARRSPYLLIFDEADRLRLDCFEMLRDLWDDARLPMLLCGNEELTAKINRQHERLFRRIGAHFEQSKLKEADFRRTLEFMGWRIGDKEFGFVWRMAGGSPGFAQALLGNARQIAESHGIEVNEDCLAGAARYFPTLAGRL